MNLRIALSCAVAGTQFERARAAFGPANAGQYSLSYTNGHQSTTNIACDGTMTYESGTTSGLIPAGTGEPGDRGAAQNSDPNYQAADGWYWRPWNRPLAWEFVRFTDDGEMELVHFVSDLGTVSDVSDAGSPYYCCSAAAQVTNVPSCPTEAPTPSPLRDSDICLGSSPNWNLAYTCEAYTGYCGSWGKDLRRCCPVSCGLTEEFTLSDCLAFPGQGTCIYPVMYPPPTPSPTATGITPSVSCMYQPRNDWAFAGTNDACVSNVAYTPYQHSDSGADEFHGHSQHVGCLQFTLAIEAPVEIRYGRAHFSDVCEVSVYTDFTRSSNTDVSGTVIDTIDTSLGGTMKTFTSSTLAAGTTVAICEGPDNSICGVHVDYINVGAPSAVQPSPNQPYDITLPATTKTLVHGICVAGAISASASMSSAVASMSSAHYTPVTPFHGTVNAWDDRNYQLTVTEGTVCSGGTYLRPSPHKVLAGTSITVNGEFNGAPPTICVWVEVGHDNRDGGFPQSLTTSDVGFVNHGLRGDIRWDNWQVLPTVLCKTVGASSAVQTSAPTSAPTLAPTLSPTPSPTDSPSKSPTQSPTAVPTASPSASPTSAGPWDLNYIGMVANFVGGNNTIDLEFDVGVGRDFRIGLYKKDCVTGIDSTLYETSSITTPIDGNATYHRLKVTHAFATAELEQSDIWNSASSTLEVCQMLHLVTNNMDIVEDERVIDVSFDLQVDFNTTVNLAPETIENVTEDVDFESDVGAYKCAGGNGNGDPFATDTTPLAPNQELAVCITSQNDNVKLDTLTNMIIAQDAAAPVQVVDGGNIVVDAITDVIYDESPGIRVETRVPIDRFSFETGKNITVSGRVELKLTNGRRLRALAGEDGVAAEDPGEAGYIVTVNLKSEADGTEDAQAPIGSSDGYASNGEGLGALFLVALAVMSLVM